LNLRTGKYDGQCLESKPVFLQLTCDSGLFATVVPSPNFYEL
jgi:hypothetical protein